MSALPHVVFLCSALIGAAGAQVPGKVSLDTYEHLWKNSPICSAPSQDRAPEPGFLADWSLRGVSEIEGGYLVTLGHRKDAGETWVIRPLSVSGGLKVERVELHPDWRDTAVHLEAGGRIGILKFDQSSLIPVTAQSPAPASAPGRPPVNRLAVPRRR